MTGPDPLDATNKVILLVEEGDAALFRNIDVPDGGVVIIRNNILEKGPNSSNRDVIGIALERLGEG